MDILGFGLDLPPALDNPLGEFLVSIGLWVLVAIGVFVIVDVALHILVRKTETDVDDQLHSIIRIPIIALVLIYGIVKSLELLDLPPSIEDMFFLFYQVVLTIALFSVGWKIYDNVLLRLLVVGTRKKDPTLEKTLVPAMEILGKVVMLFIGIIVFLGYLGVDITILVASFGIAGLVIAFAAQDSLSNLFAGVLLLLDKPFKVGDIVLLEDGDYYEVKRVGMRSTRLYDVFMNTMSVVPNSMIAGQRIINVTDPDFMIKTRVKVDVAYTADVEKAMAIMRKIASEDEHVLQEEGKKPFVMVAEFKDSGVALTMVVWIDDYNNQWASASNMRIKVLKEFKAHGVEIPFPQMVVHMAES